MPPREEVRMDDETAGVQGNCSYGSLDDQYKDDTSIDEENQTEMEIFNRPSNEYVLNIAFFSFVGFLSVQAVFALIANSQSMLADSEAMSIDALTYLFNMVAERMKNRPLNELEHQMSPILCHYKRGVRILYLELIPPLISIFTLFCITVFTMKEAVGTLRGAERSDTDDVSVPTMLTFSSLNLLLDFVNVSCFARSHSLFALDRSSLSLRDFHGEASLILGTSRNKCGNDSCNQKQMPLNKQRSSIVSNLNMCSAWTHICADTMRSTAVMVAAAFATIIPGVDGKVTDSVAAIVVSVIIFVSMFPLLQGLLRTGTALIELQRNPPLVL